MGQEWSSMDPKKKEKYEKKAKELKEQYEKDKAKIVGTKRPAETKVAAKKDVKKGKPGK